jgi:hypothetical protein
MTVTQTPRDEDRATTTLHPPLQIVITVTASLCIIAAHCSQSTNFSNGPHILSCVLNAELFYLVKSDSAFG